MSMSWFYYSFTTTYLFGFVWKCWETPFHPSVNHHFPYSKYHNATGGIHPPFSEPDLSPFHQASSGKFRLSMEPRKRCRCRVSWPNHWRWKEVFIYPTYSCVYVIDGLDMVRCIYMLCVCIYIYTSRYVVIYVDLTPNENQTMRLPSWKWHFFAGTEGVFGQII